MQDVLLEDLPNSCVSSPNNSLTPAGSWTIKVPQLFPWIVENLDIDHEKDLEI